MNEYSLHWNITIKKVDDCESISSVNPLYLRINHASGYIEEKNGNKYLVFDSADRNKELLKKFSDFWDGIKYEMSLNKSLKFHAVTINIRSVFEEDGKLYLQLFLDDPLYKLRI